MTKLDQSCSSSQSDHAIERGREAFRRQFWTDAYALLSDADQETPLAADDLQLLATSAYLIGHDDEYLTTLERAYGAYSSAGNGPQAIRCAFWLGLQLFLRGETGPGTGWLARAQRLLEREEHECVERGYLLLAATLRRLQTGDWRAAFLEAAATADIGERFAEDTLIAAARLLQGRALLHQGKIEEGLALLDEAMVTVTTGELPPMAAGLIYCSVIDGCQQVYAVERAREWTAALTRWCDEQPDLVFTGICMVHRAEIMQLSGAWADAIAHARRACERLAHKTDQQTAAAAFYQQAEIHRLRGEFDAAENAYRRASQWGLDPQPGMALLRLAQGHVDAAVAAIRRALGAAIDPLNRIRQLPAYVEIMLAAGDVPAARSTANELALLAESSRTDVLKAMASHSRGAVALFEGDAQAALDPLRHAFDGWRQVEAPYLAARVRVQIGWACRALGDEDGAKLELAAAQHVFEQLGAAPDLQRLQERGHGAPAPVRSHPLTKRERDVLCLIAAGKTNKVIGANLFISEKTVDRHVSNIFNKLNVPSRAAATAYAYQHKLI